MFSFSLIDFCVNEILNVKMKMEIMIPDVSLEYDRKTNPSRGNYDSKIAKTYG